MVLKDNKKSNVPQLKSGSMSEEKLNFEKLKGIERLNSYEFIEEKIGSRNLRATNLLKSRNIEFPTEYVYMESFLLNVQRSTGLATQLLNFFEDNNTSSSAIIINANSAKLAEINGMELPNNLKEILITQTADGFWNEMDVLKFIGFPHISKWPLYQVFYFLVRILFFFLD